MNDPRAGSRPSRPTWSTSPHLVTAYYTQVPDPTDVDQRVAFGTSGHRGSSLRTAFNETHILATTQAICEYRTGQGYDGPLFLGRDTHALSEPAWAHGARGARRQRRRPCCVDDRDGYTPTPAVSHAILARQPRAATGGRPGRRHRRHPVAQPARATAASSTTRRTAARPTPTPPA